MLGFVCDLLRARVTSKKDSVMLRSTWVRIQVTDLTFVENPDTPRTARSRSSV